MKKNIFIFTSLAVVLIPTVTMADFDLGSLNFKTFIDEILSVINIIIPILFSLAFIVFFWGLSKFILHSNNAADIEKGKSYMLWSILALFTLLTFRAIISLVATDLDIGNGNTTPVLRTNGVTPVTGGGIVPPPRP